MKKVYLAGPWFTPAQDKIIEDVKAIFDKYELPYFSPKDECLFDENCKFTPEAVLNMNISAIEDSSYVFAITDGKDPGTIWECGYAYAKNIPIVYIWLGRQRGQKFNLMLAASGVETVHHLQGVSSVAFELALTGSISRSSYEGEIE